MEGRRRGRGPPRGRPCSGPAGSSGSSRPAGHPPGTPEPAVAARLERDNVEGTADTWPGEGTPLAPVTRNEVMPPAETATLPTAVAGGTGVKVPPSSV